MRPIALASALLAAPSAFAAGLGHIRVLSHLGQPLELRIALTGSDIDQLPDRCVRVEVSAGDVPVSDRSLQVRYERGASGYFSAMRILSQVSIQEPFVQVQVSLLCPQEITRQWTVLLDPPGWTGSASPSATEESTSAVVSLPDSPLGELVQSVEGAPKKPAPKAERARAPAAETSGNPAPKPARRSLPAPPSAAPKSARPSLKLDQSSIQWSGPSNTVAGTTAAAAPGASSAAVQAPPAPAESVASAPTAVEMAEAEKWKAMDAALRQMQAEQSKSQSRILELQTQLRSAQSESDGVFRHLALLLGALLLIAVGAVFWLWREIKRQREAPPWWQTDGSRPEGRDTTSVGGLSAALDSRSDPGFVDRKDASPADSAAKPAAQAASALPDAGASAAALAPVSGTGPDAASAGKTPASVPSGSGAATKGAGPVGAAAKGSESLLSSLKADERDHWDAKGPPTPAHQAAQEFKNPAAPTLELAPRNPLAAMPLPVPAARSGRPAWDDDFDDPRFTTQVLLPGLRASASEVVDLDQQVDFFLTLGQEDEAVQLLESTVFAPNRGNPNAYLRLLDIHRRRGRPEAYEKVRDVFKDKFNCLVPAFGDNERAGKTLEDYPEFMKSIVNIWSDPAEASREMNELLARRASPSWPVIDLPAYRDLMLLYSVAQDVLAHKEGLNSQFDLEL